MTEFSLLVKCVDHSIKTHYEGKGAGERAQKMSEICKSSWKKRLVLSANRYLFLTMAYFTHHEKLAVVVIAQINSNTRTESDRFAG